MNNGYINVRFFSGEEDGEIVENAPINKLTRLLSFPSDTYFAETGSGGMCIRKGKLNALWHSYSVNVYERKEDKQDFAVYEYLENRMVERCSVSSKKGTQCMKPAIHGEVYCQTHNKQEL